MSGKTGCTDKLQKQAWWRIRSHTIQIKVLAVTSSIHIVCLASYFVITAFVLSEIANMTPIPIFFCFRRMAFFYLFMSFYFFFFFFKEFSYFIGSGFSIYASVKNSSHEFKVPKEEMVKFCCLFLSWFLSNGCVMTEHRNYLNKAGCPFQRICNFQFAEELILI